MLDRHPAAARHRGRKFGHLDNPGRHQLDADGCVTMECRTVVCRRALGCEGGGGTRTELVLSEDQGKSKSKLSK